ncbi:HAUS augmin-like complex subunit 6 [Rhynchocyon petersi]
MNMKTPKGKNKTASKKTSQFEVEASPPTITAGNAENTENSTVGTSLQAKKCDPFQKEQDHLVDEVARAVLSDSPKLYEGKEVQELIDSLVSNPFLTRKQIPRTPENLINEIRSSWRKAIENEDDGSAQPIQMNSEHREVLSASLPVLHNQPECSMPSFLSTTTLSDISQSSLPEEVVSDCLKRVPQEHVTASQRGDTPAQNHSDLLNKKRACRQDLERTDLCTELSQTSQTETLSPAVQNRMDVMDGNKDKYVELLDHLQACNKEHSMQKRTLWNSFQLSSGISSKSFEDADFGILHETLPEEVGHLSLNSSNTSEFNFELEPNSPMPSGNFPDDTVGGIQTTPKSDLNLQAICRRYEALKKSLSKKMEDSYHSCPETLERQKPELSLTPNKMQTDDMLNFLDVHDLHTDYSKTSFRETLSERKRSLSPLIKFSPEEQRLRTIIPISLGEFLPNLKEDEIQSENLDAEKSPSDLKR